MRMTLLVIVITSCICASATAQSIRIEIANGQSLAGMQAVTTPYATGGPWAGVPARGVKPGITPAVTDFRIRAWMEGEGARVLVFAVTRKPGSPLGNDDERESQIASVALTPGTTMEIAATEKYNARPITLTAVAVTPTQRRYTVEYIGDIPVRPWTPPPPRR